MIKLGIIMVRRSDLTYELFIQHWREVHGPLFAAQSESKQIRSALYSRSQNGRCVTRDKGLQL